MPREVGQEGVENISGIAWDDVAKINAIDKDNSSISKKFMEDAIDEMYNELDDPFTGF